MFASLFKQNAPIAIIVAMQSEADALLEKLHIKKNYQHNRKFVYEGKLGKRSTVVTISGIGKVNAALTTQFIIDRYRPKHIFNLGVAGGIAKEVAIGDVVIGREIFYSDFDLSAFGYQLGEVPDMGLGFASTFLKKENKLNNNLNSFIKYGNIITADQFENDPKHISELSIQFNALAKDMESAAIAQTCQINTTPFDVIRGISDLSRENALVEFNNHLEKAIQNYTKVFLENLNQLIDQ
jgi:adenosylhomocysteine nucleosidase